jgi:MerR family transcriptional regulator, redox-sensitive transcriptional activator SoxR
MIVPMLSIGEIARRAGLRASALRYYERLGLLPAPQRKSGRRQYGDDVLDRLTVIRFARESGFTLREIRKLFDGRPYSTGMRKLAAAKVAELDALIERARMMQALLKMALRCNCLSLEECGKRMRRAAIPR